MSFFSGASWIYNLPQKNAEEVIRLDQAYYHRLGNLAAVDDMVGNLIRRLEYHNILDNTYVVYTTDNGITNDTKDIKDCC